MSLISTWYILLKSKKEQMISMPQFCTYRSPKKIYSFRRGLFIVLKSTLCGFSMLLADFLNFLLYCSVLFAAANSDIPSPASSLHVSKIHESSRRDLQVGAHPYSLALNIATGCVRGESELPLPSQKTLERLHQEYRTHLLAIKVCKYELKYKQERQEDEGNEEHTIWTKIKILILPALQNDSVRVMTPFCLHLRINTRREKSSLGKW